MTTARPRLTLDIRFRAHQLIAYKARKRFDARVWHRRSGKTFATVSEQLVDTLACQLPEPRFAFIAPTRVQARAIAWVYFRRFTERMPGAGANESDLRITLPRKAEIQLLGAEQYDSLRGRYLDGVVIDEAALVPRSAWSQVLLPALSDRQGRATVMGTPAGWRNLLGEVWKAAQGDPEWSTSFYRWQDTGALSEAEVERMRRMMRPEEFAQELECSFNAAIVGAYFGREMAEAERAGRITEVRYDAMLPVVAAVDLGWSDALAVGFFQQVGTETRCIRASVHHQTSIPELVNGWRELPWKIVSVVLPHDARVHELGSGKTRQEVFHQMGCATVLAPSLEVHEGISQLRDLLPHLWIDRTAAADLVEALLAYRSEYQEVRGVQRKLPLHDWSSHLADMARYYATGRPITPGNWGDNSALYRRLARGAI